MKTSANGIAFICDWEKFAFVPYPDADGNWTLGYGHCQKPGEAIPKNITEAAAYTLMSKDLREAEAVIASWISAPLLQCQFDALVSLAYNCGAAAVMPATSTLARLLNARRFGEAAIQFLRWDMSGGKHLPGLAKRRLAERRIFELSIYDSTH